MGLPSKNTMSVVRIEGRSFNSQSLVIIVAELPRGLYIVVRLQDSQQATKCLSLAPQRGPRLPYFPGS